MEEHILADRYRLVRPLGQGGMGEVWEARDESLRRPVAVKVVSVLAGGGSRAAEARARFLREARITAALQHPNIVTVHDLGEAVTPEGTTPFLVMELLRGRGLDAVVRRGPVDGTDAARWGTGICEALAEAHEAGVLHRDIKPANVFVTASGGVKVLDFGIARAADPSATGDRLTQTGFLVGTAAYMAPEQARGHPERRSDLYALGCVLFELLTGRPPFTAPDTVGYLTAHLQDTPPAPSAVAAGLSPAWDRLVLRLLAKEPEQRYGSAAELADELRQLGDPAQATPPAPPRAATVAAPARPAPDATTEALAGPAGRRDVNRRDLLLGGAGLAVLAAGGGSAALYLTGAPRRGPVAWSRNIGGAETALVADGRCHVAGVDSDSAVLHGLDLASGEPLWSAALDGPWVTGTHLAVVDGTVLTLTALADYSSNVVRAFDAASGDQLWQRPVALGTTRVDVHRPSGLLIMGEDTSVAGFDSRTGDSRWGVDASPFGGYVLAGDLVLFDGMGMAVLAATGDTRWERTDMYPRGDLGHALDTGILCYEVGEAPVDLVFRDARTGAVEWRTPFQREEPEPYVGAFRPIESLVSGTTVLLPPVEGDRERPTALDGLTGEPKWTHDGPYHPDEPARSVAGGFVLPAPEGRVCLAADDGTERWLDEAEDTDAVWATGDRALLYRTRRERLFRRWTTVRILDAEDGREAWSGAFDNHHVSPPASDGDLVVVVDGGGTVWALRV